MVYSEKLQNVLYLVDDEIDSCWDSIIELQKAYHKKNSKYFQGGVTESREEGIITFLSLMLVRYPSGFVLIARTQVDGEEWERRRNWGPDTARNKPWKLREAP